MTKFRCLIVLGTPILLLFLSAAAQPGFFNINCGATKIYTDFQTNLTWSGDSDYVDAGKRATVANSSIPFHLQSLRFFPQPLNKSCYRLPLKRNETYLLRLWFLFGNYNGIQTIPAFNVSLETEGMLFQKIQAIYCAETPQSTTEKILTSSSGILYVCFIRTTDHSDPFISAIELRSLLSGMYDEQVKFGTMLSSIARYDFGAEASVPLRYPHDQFDRIWLSDRSLAIVYNNGSVYPNAVVRKSKSRNMVSNTSSSINFPPRTVMETAIVANADRLRFDLEPQNTKTLIVLYFEDVEILNASESRNFDVMINDQVVCNVQYALQKYSIEVPVVCNDTQAEQLIISLDEIDQKGKFNRNPLLNALEYYKIINSIPETFAQDVDVLLSIKRDFDFKSWISDPCFGIQWNGIKCSKDDPVRILEIDLSGRNLSGSVPQRFNELTELRSLSLHNNKLSGSLPTLCNMTRLQILDLQNNILSGSIPECLSHLINLRELNLENNNFSGVVPQRLLNNRLLNIKYSGNPHLCSTEFECQSKGKKLWIEIPSIIGAVLGVSMVLISIFIYGKRYLKKQNLIESHHQGSLVEIPHSISCRSFTTEELMMATQNFSQKIGQGGFGSVYFGNLQNGKEVAVKVLSATSKQGVTEFLNEIDLLSRIHHKNLLCLLGYCNDSKEPMLVYEHMSGGSLKDHLYGSLADSSSLNWKTRVQIALDAAQEYLHVSCTPKIIHRDVKTSNILLDFNMLAKMADFGLSRIVGDDIASHVTTTVKGTVGYLDPEYMHTNKLTEKSDVYSFGVVLLEIICGRSPIDSELCDEKISLVKWVLSYEEANEDSARSFMEILDKKLSMSDDDMNSFYQIVRLSIRCIQSEASKRPTITEIVREIRDAMISIESHHFGLEEALCSSECSCSVLHVGR